MSWVTKLLALDQPGDLRRYIIPKSVSIECKLSQEPLVLNESLCRRVLGRRCDFPKDAVAKVKIPFDDR
jgi:hypothetical protein